GPELRSHGVYRDVDLGGSGAGTLRRATHEPCEPDARQPEDRSTPSCRRRHHSAVRARLAAAPVGRLADPAVALRASKRGQSRNSSLQRAALTPLPGRSETATSRPAVELRTSIPPASASPRLWGRDSRVRAGIY